MGQNRTKVGLKHVRAHFTLQRCKTAKSNQGGIETGGGTVECWTLEEAKSNQGGIETDEFEREMTLLQGKIEPRWD